MPELGTPEQAGAPVAPAAHVNPITVPAAIGLWVLVGGLLGYGILQTVIKAAALFG